MKLFGKEVTTVWKDLRPMTKNMLVKALRTSLKKPTFSYDTHADWELSNLLNALDAEVQISAPDETEKTELVELAEICVNVLESQTESAEVFIQLAERSLTNNDFARFDLLGAALLERFSAGESAEIIRQTKLPQIRAVAFETMAVLPVVQITQLLEDPLYFDIACTVLEQQAVEYESDEARLVLEQLEFVDEKNWQ